MTGPFIITPFKNNSHLLREVGSQLSNKQHFADFECIFYSGIHGIPHLDCIFILSIYSRTDSADIHLPCNESQAPSCNHPWPYMQLRYVGSSIELDMCIVYILCVTDTINSSTLIPRVSNVLASTPTSYITVWSTLLVKLYSEHQFI